MDLETENRIAAILMKEAAELRRQAEKDGVNAYLRQPNVRARPNSRFLTATVLGVHQANRVVEVNEMWRIRQKEQELDDRLKRRQRDQSSSDRSYRAHDVEDRWKRKWSDESSIGRSYRNSEVDDRLRRRRSDDIGSDQSYREQEVDDGIKRKWSDESSSDRSYGEIEADDRVTRRSSNRSYKDKMYADGDLLSKESSQKYSLVEEGLKDDEIENFLKSRVKRGRGAIGSRMDETGPYLPPRPLSNAEQITFIDMVSRIERDRNAVLGPEKPSHLVSWSSSEEESTKKKNRKAKKVKKDSSSKHSRKRKSNGKSKDKSKKKRKEDRRHQKQK